jgi:hypothetical protein
MAFVEDLAAFLDVDMFADPVVFTSGDQPVAYAPKACNGIFDATFTDAQVGSSNLETNQPRVMVRAEDVPGVKRGDLCTVKGRTFDVMQVQPDGTGMAVVYLAEG